MCNKFGYCLFMKNEPRPHIFGSQSYQNGEEKRKGLSSFGADFLHVTFSDNCAQIVIGNAEKFKMAENRAQHKQAWPVWMHEDRRGQTLIL